MTRAGPLVSVILPTFDRAGTLEASARSVLDQQGADLELIVVDDASTDETAEVVARLEQDPRVEAVRLPDNRGAGAARNEGLARARGAFVAFQDSDDIWLPKMLTTLLDTFSTSGRATGVCYGTTVKRSWAGSSRIPGQWVQNRTGGLGRALARGNFIGLPATLSRRSILEDVGGFDEVMRTLEDWEMWLRVAEVTEFAFVEADLVLSPTSAGGTNAFSTATLAAVARIEARHQGLFRSDPAAAAQLAYLRGVALAARGDGGEARERLVEAQRLAPSGKFRLAAAAAALGPGAVGVALAAAKQLAALGPPRRMRRSCERETVAPDGIAPDTANRETLPPVAEATVSVVVPTRNPGAMAERLCTALGQQTLPAKEVVVIDSASDDGSTTTFLSYGARLLTATPRAFRHGQARNLAARHATGDILVFLTQDVVPEPTCLERLVAPLVAGHATASYARQVAGPNASPLERFARSRNYPPEDFIVEPGNVSDNSVRTYFFSNACSAVRADVFWQLDGFPEEVIMNEDMNFAARLLRSGHRIAYRSTAVVGHTHRHSLASTFRRYFDIGVALDQSDPELRNATTTREGLSFVRELLVQLVRDGHGALIPVAVAESACKWLGHFLGRRHRSLPKAVRRRLSLHRAYWLSTDTE